MSAPVTPPRPAARTALAVVTEEIARRLDDGLLRLRCAARLLRALPDHLGERVDALKDIEADTNAAQWYGDTRGDDRRELAEALRWVSRGVARRAVKALVGCHELPVEGESDDARADRHLRAWAADQGVTLDAGAAT